MANPFTALSEHVTAMVAAAGKSVVAIHARHRFASSGVHWAPGIIVTAEHTIRRDEDITITAPDGSTLAAELAGRDAGTDLAVLKVEGLKASVAARATNFKPQPGALLATIGRSKDSEIVALGPLASISPESRTWRGGRLDQVLRLGMDLHPGASGGAVVDSEGKLIGIATAALSRVSAFAIPLATVERAAKHLITHGRIPRGYIGVGLQPIALPEHLIKELKRPAGTALIVISVGDDTPAGRAGVTIGDILLELGGRVTQSPEDVHLLLDSQSIGTKLAARILRGGKPVDVTVTVSERPPKAS